MSHETQAPSPTDEPRIPIGSCTGVQMVDGHPDLSHAATVHVLGEKPRATDGAVTPEQFTPPFDRRKAALQRLDDVRAEARAAGVSESELKSWANMCRSNDRPSNRKSAFRVVTRGRGISPEQAQSLVLRYDKEVTRAKMPASVFHYHQTGAVSFESILRRGSIMSNESQMATGLVSARSGSSRPDVVQFTQDRIDRDGHLIPGISMGVDMGKGGSITLVFDESIMDDPRYDGATKYPNIPDASLNHLAAVAVDRLEEIPAVRAALVDAGRQGTIVLTRQDWINRYQ